jgi:hypothetical protein
MTSGTATKLADEQADAAVVVALTPGCAEKFLQNSDAKANLAALQQISTGWEQGEYLEKGGWATRPGATSLRLPFGQGVCREVGPTQNRSPMN